MKILTVLLCVFCGWGMLGSFLYADAPADLRLKFYSAGEAYKQGKYTEAVEFYENIFSSGYESGPLYYNLGNSYVKDNRIGKAVLNYERAKELMPRDSDLVSNDHYARSLLSRQEEGSQPLLSWILLGYQKKITLNELTMISLGIFILAGIMYMLGLKVAPLKSKIGVIECILMILLIFNTVILVVKWHYLQKSAIAITDAEVKYEPSNQATTYFKLPEGSEVALVNREGDWHKIKRLDGKIGWVPQSAIEKINSH